MASSAGRAAPPTAVTGHRFSGDESFVSTELPLQTRTPIGVLFSHGYGVTTVSLWITYFMGLMVIYLLTGWLPTIMKDAGLSIATAANVTAMFQIGGTLGAIVVGWAMDKARPAFMIGAAYLCGGLCILALSQLGVLSPTLAALIFSTGFCMSGAETGLNAFAPGCYPTMARHRGELDARHRAVRQHTGVRCRRHLARIGLGLQRNPCHPGCPSGLRSHRHRVDAAWKRQHVGNGSSRTLGAWIVRAHHPPKSCPSARRR